MIDYLRCYRRSMKEPFECTDFNFKPFGQFNGLYDHIQIEGGRVSLNKNEENIILDGMECFDYQVSGKRYLLCFTDAETANEEMRDAQRLIKVQTKRY